MALRTSLIAVVDDDLRLLESLQELLESAGYSVRSFNSAGLFLNDMDALSESDCLIADIDMPTMDGFQLMGIAKQARPQLPIILITGRHEAAYQKRAVADGGQFFRKPFDGQALLSAIGNALQNVPKGK